MNTSDYANLNKQPPTENIDINKSNIQIRKSTSSLQVSSGPPKNSAKVEEKVNSHSQILGESYSSRSKGYSSRSLGQKIGDFFKGRVKVVHDLEKYIVTIKTASKILGVNRLALTFKMAFSGAERRNEILKTTSDMKINLEILKNLMTTEGEKYNPGNKKGETIETVINRLKENAIKEIGPLPNYVMLRISKFRANLEKANFDENSGTVRLKMNEIIEDIDSKINSKEGIEIDKNEEKRGEGICKKYNLDKGNATYLAKMFKIQEKYDFTDKQLVEIYRDIVINS